MSKEQIDLSAENIAALHNDIVDAKKDIYTFLKERFAHLSVEERLKYLAAILNDHFDSYEKTGKELRDGGYIIQEFVPKEEGR